MAKVISAKKNRRGIEYALVQDGESFSVHKRCENYAPHCKGGMSITWRYVEISMTREEAQKLFDRRAA